MKPTCYIFNNRSRYITAYPAEVVKETKSTITVRTLTSGMESTFQKRKVYGEDRYYDPRVRDDKGNFGSWADIDERGQSTSFYPNRLTFDVERIEARLAAEKGNKERRDRAKKVIEMVETYFRKHYNRYGDYSDDPAFMAVLDKLEKALEGVEVKP